MRVSTSVHMVGGGGLSHQGDCCAYLADVDGHLIMIDAGTGLAHSRICDNIKEAGYDVSDIEILVLTHCHIDHVGGAAAIKQASGCEILAHEGDKRAIEGYDGKRTAAELYGIEYIPVDVSRVLGDGDSIVPDSEKLTAVHVPGHTPGSLAVHYVPGGIEYSVLFGQDVHGPFHEDWGSDEEEWKRSLKKLLNMQADILCEGHYGVVQPRERVEDFIKGFLGE